VRREKAAESAPVKYWEIIADNLKKAGWSWGCFSAIDSNGELHFLTKPALATQFAPQGSQAEQSATEQRNC
jgi:hypothetical protein